VSLKNKRLIGYVVAATAVAVCVALIVARRISRLPEPHPTTTPQEQVRNLYKATLDGDQNAYLSGFAITNSGQRDFVESGFLVARSEMKFRARVTKEYGEDAWDRLQKPAKNDDSEFHASLSAPTAEGYTALESLPEPTSEDSYSYSAPGGPLEIRRTNNGWLAVIPAGDYGPTTELMHRMRSAIDELSAELEGDNISFETLHKNFNSEMAKAWGFTLKKSTRD